MGRMPCHTMPITYARPDNGQMEGNEAEAASKAQLSKGP